MPRKLALSFNNASGKTFTFRFFYAKANPSASNVKSLMDKIISTELFACAPVTKKSAKIITTAIN